jgi:ABC-2 type transport system permease protein
VVGVLLRLRFRVLANTLARNPLQLVAVILGGVLALLMLLVALGGLLVASTAPPEATQAVVVVGGAALVLGWLIVPLLFDGVDRTLDPPKLARFPLRTDQLMLAMFLVGATWIPGILTIAGSIATAIAWRAYPVSAGVAVVTGLIGAATCIAGSRLVTAVAGTVLRGRGAARIAIALLAVLVLAAPLALAASGGGRADLAARFTAAVDVLGWTPFGAAWSVAGRVALGDPPGAAVALMIAVGTLAGVGGLWWLVLGARATVRGDRPVRAVAGGRLGALGWMPATPAGAVAARSLIYWFRDSRQSRQLILLPVLPALMLLWWQLFGFEWMAIAAGPLVASLLPLSAFAALSYDGTAFAAELAAGVRGRDDRLGRSAALLMIAVPSVAVVQVVIAVLIGRVGDLPALLGLSLCTLLVATGVISVSSARFVVPVARSGRNPFSAQPGAATVSIFASYGVALATIILTLPVLGVAVAALIMGSAVLGWVTLVAGLVLGVGVALGGAVLGGRLLDATGPAMLARLRLIQA